MAYRILLICFSFVLSLVVGFAGSAGFSFIRSWYLGPEEITVRKTVHAELPKAEYAYVPEPDEKLLPFPFPERQGGSVARFDSGDAPSSSSSSGVDESLRERVRKAAEEEGLISRSGSGSTPSPDAGAAGEAESISGVRPITTSTRAIPRSASSSSTAGSSRRATPSCPAWSSPQSPLTGRCSTSGERYSQ